MTLSVERLAYLGTDYVHRQAFVADHEKEVRPFLVGSPTLLKESPFDDKLRKKPLEAIARNIVIQTGKGDPRFQRASVEDVADWCILAEIDARNSEMFYEHRALERRYFVDRNGQEPKYKGEERRVSEHPNGTRESDSKTGGKDQRFGGVLGKRAGIALSLYNALGKQQKLDAAVHMYVSPSPEFAASVGQQMTPYVRGELRRYNPQISKVATFIKDPKLIWGMIEGLQDVARFRFKMGERHYHNVPWENIGDLVAMHNLRKENAIEGSGRRKKIAEIRGRERELFSNLRVYQGCTIGSPEFHRQKVKKFMRGFERLNKELKVKMRSSRARFFRDGGTIREPVRGKASHLKPHVAAR